MGYDLSYLWMRVIPLVIARMSTNTYLIPLLSAAMNGPAERGYADRSEDFAKQPRKQ
jgi:hypothetical protein